jgi:hypothetical protein
MMNNVDIKLKEDNVDIKLKEDNVDIKLKEDNVNIKLKALETFINNNNKKLEEFRAFINNNKNIDTFRSNNKDLIEFYDQIKEKLTEEELERVMERVIENPTLIATYTEFITKNEKEITGIEDKENKKQFISLLVDEEWNEYSTETKKKIISLYNSLTKKIPNKQWIIYQIIKQAISNQILIDIYTNLLKDNPYQYIYWLLIHACKNIKTTIIMNREKTKETKEEQLMNTCEQIKQSFNILKTNNILESYVEIQQKLTEKTLETVMERVIENPTLIATYTEFITKHEKEITQITDKENKKQFISLLLEECINDLTFSDTYDKYTKKTKEEIVEFYNNLTNHISNKKYIESLTKQILAAPESIKTHNHFLKTFNYKILLSGRAKQKSINLLYTFQRHNLLQYMQLNTEYLEKTLFQGTEGLRVKEAMNLLNDQRKLTEFFAQNFKPNEFMDAIKNIDEMRLFKLTKDNKYILNQDFILFQPTKDLKEEKDMSFEEIMRNIIPKERIYACVKNYIDTDYSIKDNYIKKHIITIQEKYKNTTFEDETFVKSFELCLWTTIMTSLNFDFNIQDVDFMIRGLDLQGTSAENYIACAFDTRLVWFKAIYHLYKENNVISNQTIFQVKFDLPNYYLEMHAAAASYNAPPKCELFDILNGFVRNDYILTAVNYTSVFDEFGINPKPINYKDITYITIILSSLIFYLTCIQTEKHSIEITNSTEDYNDIINPNTNSTANYNDIINPNTNSTDLQEKTNYTSEMPI